MFCPNCGTQNPDDARICSNCGRNLPGAAPAPQAQPAPSAFPGGQAMAVTNVPNYLVQSILVTVLCCVPFGIVAIVFAAQVNSKLAAGDYAGAMDASKKAKMWSWIAFGSGLAVVALWAIFAFAGIVGGFGDFS